MNPLTSAKFRLPLSCCPSPSPGHSKPLKLSALPSQAQTFRMNLFFPQILRPHHEGERSLREQDHSGSYFLAGNQRTFSPPEPN